MANGMNELSEAKQAKRRRLAVVCAVAGGVLIVSSSLFLVAAAGKMTRVVHFDDPEQLGQHIGDVLVTTVLALAPLLFGSIILIASLRRYFRLRNA